MDNAKVLIVDDEPSLCLLYKEELESEGYIVRTASDAASALRSFNENPPDLVVMDIRMPGMDGIEVMCSMLSRKRDLPVILNTAYGAHKQDFLSWPAEAYLLKSSDLGELKAHIRRVTERLMPGV